MQSFIVIDLFSRVVFFIAESQPSRSPHHVLICVRTQGGVSAHIAPAAHVSDCGALLQSAGFSLPTVDVDTITVRP